MRSHPFQAVLFDLDGTLLDTLDDLANSMNAVLRSMGYAEYPRERYREFVGNGVTVLAQRVLPESERANPATVEETVRRMLEEYGHRWAQSTRPYPGITELLDILAARQIPTAILSNKPHPFTLATVDRFLGSWPFAVVRGAQDSVPKKPDPAGAIQIALALDLPPRAFLSVGDTATDMETAIAAGMTPAGALWGFRTETELRQAGARHLLADPLELLHYL